MRIGRPQIIKIAKESEGPPSFDITALRSGIQEMVCILILN
jgi:hypothetical protein